MRKVLVAMPDTKLVIYCVYKQVEPSEAYNLLITSSQIYDLLKAERKMSTREAAEQHSRTVSPPREWTGQLLRVGKSYGEGEVLALVSSFWRTQRKSNLQRAHVWLKSSFPK